MIARDKQLHLLAGAIIALTAFILGWWAMVLVVGAGVGKEVFYDRFLKLGTFDPIDALATIIGGGVVTAGIQLIF